jgi:hypothetical protein
MFCLLNYLYAYTEARSKAKYVGLYRTATADLGNDAGGTRTAGAAAAEAEGPEATRIQEVATIPEVPPGPL